MINIDREALIAKLEAKLDGLDDAFAKETERKENDWLRRREAFIKEARKQLDEMESGQRQEFEAFLQKKQHIFGWADSDEAHSREKDQLARCIEVLKMSTDKVVRIGNGQRNEIDKILNRYL